MKCAYIDPPLLILPFAWWDNFQIEEAGEVQF